jgi:putative flippase GtrA
VISRRLEALPLARLVRCFSVSVLTSLVSLTTLALLAGVAGVPAWQANVVACAVGTVPSYQLNRRWVWGLRHGSHWGREVAPFWALSFAGLALSTLAVDRADHLARSLAWTGPTRTVALMGASVVAYGLLWVAQFLILDKVLFVRPGDAVEPPAPVAVEDRRR